MSREQTPITAEEWLIKNDYHNLLITSDAMEQYAQAKVLEALEEVIKLSHYVEYGGEAVDVVEVRDIETEVKPKYERN
jgi:hypothetical protein